MFSISGIERWVFEPCWGSVSAPDRAGAWMRIRMFEAKDQRTLVRLFQRILGLEDTTNPSKSNRKTGQFQFFVLIWPQDSDMFSGCMLPG